MENGPSSSSVKTGDTNSYSKSQPQQTPHYNSQHHSGASKYNVYQSSNDTFSWTQHSDNDVNGGELYLSGTDPAGYGYAEAGGDLGYGNEAGVARAVRDEDSLVEQISHETGCQVSVMNCECFIGKFI